MVDIQVRNLTKFFVIGENLLDNLSFEIQEGERVAILGRNGCGKTTLFNILTGQMDYDSGEVYVNPNKRLGLISQIPIFPEGYNTPYKPGLFSQGQWQLLSIARAVATNPRILLLDEITANLDADTEQTVLSALNRAGNGRTVLSISHRLYEKNGGRQIAI